MRKVLTQLVRLGGIIVFIAVALYLLAYMTFGVIIMFAGGVMVFLFLGGMSFLSSIFEKPNKANTDNKNYSPPTYVVPKTKEVEGIQIEEYNDEPTQPLATNEQIAVILVVIVIGILAIAVFFIYDRIMPIERFIENNKEEAKPNIRKFKYLVSYEDSLSIVNKAKRGWTKIYEKTKDKERTDRVVQFYIMNTFIDSAYKQISGAGIITTSDVNIPYIYRDSAEYFRDLYGGYYDKLEQQEENKLNRKQ